jgi:putative hemin transport protein
MKATLEQNNKQDIKAQWELLKQDNPKMRIKNCADKLGVSELALVLTDLGSANPKITLLKGNPVDIIRRVKEIGYVMALSRNDSCVNERKGVYGDLTVEHGVGLIVGKDIDLRIFFSNWKYSVAVEEEFETGWKRSLQFFDSKGVAIHKIHLNEKSDHNAFLKLVSDFTDESGEYEPIADSKAGAKQPVTKSDLSDTTMTTAFLQEWSELKDTHDFYGLLRKHKVSRLESMKIGDGKFTRELALDSVRNLLNISSEKGTSIMVFVYNPGMVQIHTGPVKNIVPTGQWINVMDPEFNLHLREDHIAQVWWVSKPTVDGDVQSIEVYDENEELIVQFFGERKPGQPEKEEWREICKMLK